MYLINVPVLDIKHVTHTGVCANALTWRPQRRVQLQKKRVNYIFGNKCDDPGGPTDRDDVVLPVWSHF